MTTFIVFPDPSAAGKVRFFDALAAHRAEVFSSWEGPPVHFLVNLTGTEAARAHFAKACGTTGRPVPTENTPQARPARLQGREGVDCA